MSTSDEQLQKRFFEYLPRWAWGILSVLVATGFVMNTLGLNFAAPLNIMAIARAEAYKENLLNPVQVVDTSALEAQVAGLEQQVSILVSEIEELQSMAHPPGSNQSGHN